jgi:hypothetical protein
MVMVAVDRSAAKIIAREVGEMGTRVMVGEVGLMITIAIAVDRSAVMATTREDGEMGTRVIDWKVEEMIMVKECEGLARRTKNLSTRDFSLDFHFSNHCPVPDNLYVRLLWIKHKSFAFAPKLVRAPKRIEKN